MAEKRKSVKRYIFASIALMAVAVIALFFISNALIYGIYADRVVDNQINGSEVAQSSYEAGTLLETWSWSDDESEESYETLSQQLAQYSFYLCVEKNGKIVYSNIDEENSESFYEIEDFFLMDGASHTYVLDGITLITYEDADAAVRVYIVSQQDTNFRDLLKNNMIWLSYYLLNIIIFIVIFCIVGSIYTKKLIRHIMYPLDALIKASDEMKNGDYSHPITYQGDWEFEDVCQSFNEMQSHVLKAQQQEAAYEKARTDMIAGISHDLRTPLTAIRGTIKGLQDGVANTPELQKKFLDTAYRRTMEMDQLLEQLFYFSKIETGNIPLCLETIEWNEFFKDYLEKLKLDDRTFEIKYFLYGTDFPLYSRIDRQQMNRILDNIVENSKKYAEVSPLVISFHLHHKADRIILWIADNGQGVEDEKLPYVFDEFYRADDSRNKTEGNGLGLHIVKYLVEAMDGTVEAQNHQGFEIKMTFPASQEDKNE